MSPLLKQARAKLASTRGDSMVESLAALLIVVLAAVLLVTMVTASTNVAASSKQAQSDAYAAESSMSLNSSAGGTASIAFGTETTVIGVKTYESRDDDGIVFQRYQNETPRTEDAP